MVDLDPRHRLDALYLGVAGGEDDRHVGVPAADAPDELDPRHVGQPDVDDEHVGQLRLDRGERLRPRARLDHGEAGLLQEIGRVHPDECVVLAEQHRERARLRPLGVPREQIFVRDFLSRLDRVGVIKTAGGLFDHLAGKTPRAPLWMQRTGFEWLWRASMEPRRLFWRYLTTNPRALYLLLRYSQ